MRHNDHIGCYQKMPDYIEGLCSKQDVGGLDIYDEQSFPLEERARCIEADEIWEII